MCSHRVGACAYRDGIPRKSWLIVNMLLGHDIIS